MDFTAKDAIWPGWALDEKLGRGCFGTVYRAHMDDPATGEQQLAAVKHYSIPEPYKEEWLLEIMPKEQCQRWPSLQVESLTRTMELLYRLRECPYLVVPQAVQAIERTEGIGWDVFHRMELLTSLPCVMRQRQQRILSEEEILRLGIHIGTALDQLATLQMLHLNITPAHLYVDDAGNFKLAGAGVAGALRADNEAQARRGLSNYAPPEYYTQGDSAADLTWDTYSLGICMYRMLNDRRLPFMKPGDMPTLSASAYHRMKGEQIPPPANGHPELVRIVMKCIAYRPEDRWQTPAAFVEALRQVRLDQPAEPDKPDAPAPRRSIWGKIPFLRAGKRSGRGE